MVTELGPDIGTYKERSIPGYIVARDERFEYDRIAFEDADGGVDLSQLAPDECVIYPGLIYRRESV